jgi:hypothetical protein
MGTHERQVRDATRDTFVTLSWGHSKFYFRPETVNLSGKLYVICFTINPWVSSFGPSFLSLRYQIYDCPCFASFN